MEKTVPIRTLELLSMMLKNRGGGAVEKFKNTEEAVMLSVKSPATSSESFLWCPSSETDIELFYLTLLACGLDAKRNPSLLRFRLPHFRLGYWAFSPSAVS